MEKMVKVFLMLHLFYFCARSGVYSATPNPVLGQGYDFANNGKKPGPNLKEVYSPNSPDFTSLDISPQLQEAVKLNNRYLSRLNGKEIKAGNLRLSAEELRNSGKNLGRRLQGSKRDFLDHFKCFKIKGEDGLGNVHFTGYFSPLIEARKKADKVFRFPIYALPKGKGVRLPTRKEIDQDAALGGLGLELAYTSDLLENYFLHVQGSGILRFEDGRMKKVGYAGSNGYPYFSIGRHLVSKGEIPAEKISLKAIRRWFEKHPEQLSTILNRNSSYTFFQWRSGEFTGTPGVTLSAGHSVAVDPRYIPFGACLLAMVPVLDEAGNLVDHQWKILFAHDSGGAIKGPGHLDLYFGLGRKAGDQAGDLHHYGRVWLILPK